MQLSSQLASAIVTLLELQELVVSATWVFEILILLGATRTALLKPMGF